RASHRCTSRHRGPRSGSWSGRRPPGPSGAAASMPSRVLAERVALAALGVDQLGRVALVDLATQMADVNVEHVAAGLGGLVVRVVPQLGARHDVAGAMREV